MIAGAGFGDTSLGFRAWGVGFRVSDFGVSGLETWV